MAEQGPERQKPLTNFLMKAREEGTKIAPTIIKFQTVMEENYSESIRLNEMTGKVEFYTDADDDWHEWGDANESMLRSWFQDTVGMYNKNMLDDAMKIFFDSQLTNPLTAKLNSLKWDGKHRIRNFLHAVFKVPATKYHSEVGRLIFAGGVHRAFRPGCKFDDMVVLTGKQGTGKSTVTRYLNMDDRYHRELKVITGKEGIEALRGAWVVEMTELMAMTRVKETEAVKAYITTQTDSYRPPYGKNVMTIPRRCIFIGTTNNPQFLTDRTGNRRFYPVNVKSDGEEIQAHETEVRAYIEQCWAEAVAMYRKDELLPYASAELRDDILKAQEAAMEDDWRIGAIEKYLEREKFNPGDTVSIVELWHRALNEPEDSKPDRKDSIEIGQIMLQFEDWEKAEKAVRTYWGPQKVFVRARKRPF